MSPGQLRDSAGGWLWRKKPSKNACCEFQTDWSAAMGFRAAQEATHNNQPYSDIEHNYIELTLQPLVVSFESCSRKKCSKNVSFLATQRRQ